MSVVAIVGSRDYSSPERVRKFIHDLPDDTEVVTGDARGVDTWAVAAARARCMPYTVFPANWRRHGKSAGPLRNALIVERCHIVVAFWDGKSPGTRITIELAQKLGKPVQVIPPEGQRLGTFHP